MVSLLSPDPNTDIDRPLKRPQRDMSVCTSGPLVSSVTHRRCRWCANNRVITAIRSLLERAHQSSSMLILSVFRAAVISSTVWAYLPSMSLGPSLLAVSDLVALHGNQLYHSAYYACKLICMSYQTCIYLRARCLLCFSPAYRSLVLCLPGANHFRQVWHR